MALAHQLATALTAQENPALGTWHHRGVTPATGVAAVRNALWHLRRPVYLVRYNNDLAVSHEGSMVIGEKSSPGPQDLPIIGYAPGLLPENLGDSDFKAYYGLQYAYLVGAMANGISSVTMVEKAGRHGLLAFFGAGGLSLAKIDTAIHQLQKSQSRHAMTFGVNLIHSPADPGLEMETVRLYLNRQIRLVSASAFMNVTLPVTYFRAKGLREDADGGIICPNRIIAKVSREEVARQFLSPPPRKHIEKLLADRLITPDEARIAQKIPTADDITAEADSGGHTDNRPALALLPTMISLRDALAKQFDYQRTPCVGLAGGIATPASTAAAFAMGAAFVLTGSVNQACREAGSSPAARQMLAEAQQADVIMAPSADMFELGVNVQVLKRGTLFPMRARKLYDLYTGHESYESISKENRQWVEQTLFKKSFEDEWKTTKVFFTQRDPRQIKRAEKSPKHKMALVFRSYLGQSSHWANSGIADRRLDYQIWCGPGMGAFNAWVKGSFLEAVDNRSVTVIADNFMFGAAVIHRFQHLRNQGAQLPTTLGNVQPQRPNQIKQYLNA